MCKVLGVLDTIGAGLSAYTASCNVVKGKKLMAVTDILLTFTLTVCVQCGSLHKVI